MVCANNNVTSFKFPLKTDDVSGRMYFQRKREVVDENMLKYNEDDLITQIRSRMSFEVGIM